MEGIKEKNRELLVTLDAIQRERQRLLALRVAIDDAIQGIDAGAPTAKSLYDVWERLNSQLDVALSTRASETTLSEVKTGTDYLDEIHGDLYSTADAKSAYDRLKEILDKLDNPADPSLVDVSDRADRLLGVVYGSQGQQLLQRATTYDLICQLRHAGAEIDPRDRNWTITESLNRAWTLSKATDALVAKIDENILGFQFLSAEPPALTVDTPDLYARVDAYKRLLVNATVVANPSNLDVALSTRASETKLESVRALLDQLEDALDSVGTDSFRVKSI